MSANKLKIEVFNPDSSLGLRASKSWPGAFREEDLDEIMATLQAASWKAEWASRESREPDVAKIDIYTKTDPVSEAVVVIGVIEHTLVTGLNNLMTAS